MQFDPTFAILEEDPPEPSLRPNLDESSSPPIQDIEDSWIAEEKKEDIEDSWIAKEKK